MLACALVLSVVGVSGCTSGNDSSPKIVIGAAAFTESQPSAYGWALPWSWSEATSYSEGEVLAELYAAVLRKAGYRTEIKSMRTSDLHVALVSGRVDLTPGYAASRLERIDAGAHLATADVGVTVRRLRSVLKKYSLLALDPARAIDVNGFAVRKDTAARLHLRTLSDLAPHASQMVLGAPSDCRTNEFCWIGLQRVYGITFKELRVLDIGRRSKAALRAGTVDVGEVLTTDTADLDKLGLVLLEDDRQLQLADAVVPIVRAARADERLRAALNRVQAVLTTEELSGLNAQVSDGHSRPNRVAQHWLKEMGLL